MSLSTAGAVTEVEYVLERVMVVDSTAVVAYLELVAIKLHSDMRPIGLVWRVRALPSEYVIRDGMHLETPRTCESINAVVNEV